MENIFFKYGVILVGGVVIMLLIAFAFQSLRSTIKLGEEEETLSGETSVVMDEIEKLCNQCLQQNIDKDCYIREIEIDSAVDPGDLEDPYVLAQALSPGTHVLKLQTQNKQCMIRKLN